jgi:hypothetical protein
VTLTINFEGSVNFSIDDGGDTASTDAAGALSFCSFLYLRFDCSFEGKLCLKATIRPFTRHFMGRIAMIDRTKRASLKMACSW